MMGGALLLPWEVEALPDEWLDAFDGLNGDLPVIREATNQVKDHKAAWLKSQGYKHGR